MFEVGKRYSASAITNGEFHGIYDQLIGLVDGKLEHFTDWHAEIQEQLEQEHKENGNTITEEEIYQEAWDDIVFHIPVAYEGCKEVYVFKGIAPNSQGFDFYSTYECAGKEVYETN